MIELKNVRKRFGDYTLFDIDHLVLPDTGIVVLKGENGCGKTTLLNILSFLDDSFEGEYLYSGKNSREWKRKDKERIRRNDISYVFQKNNLLSFLNAEENIHVYDSDIERGSKRKVNTYSQGQQEIIALKRALRYKKKIYLLDEVFSSLDEKNRSVFYSKLEQLSKESLVIAVSHDVILDGIADEVYEFEDHRLKQLKAKARVAKVKQEEPNERKLNSKKLYSGFLLSSEFSMFLHTVLLTCMMLFGFSGCSVLLPDSVVGSLGLVNEERFITLGPKADMTSDEIMKEFPNQSYLMIHSNAPIGYSDKFPADDKVYCNQKTFDYFNQTGWHYIRDNRFKVNSENIYDIVIDDSIKGNIFFMNKNDNSSHFYQEMPEIPWKTGYRSAERYIFLSEKTYKQLFHVDTLPSILEDDTFYVFDPNLASASITEYNIPKISSNNDYLPDFNRIFGSEPRKAEYLYWSIPDTNLDSVVLLSDKTASRIQVEYDLHHSVIIDTWKRKAKIALFVFSHRYSINQDFSSNSEKVSNYNRIYSSSENKNHFTYGIFFYFMFFLMLLFEIAFFLFILYQNRKNIRILYSLGMSRFSLFLMLFLPIFPVFLVSSILGSFLCQAGFLFQTTAYLSETLYALLILVLVFLINYGIYSRRLLK